MNLPKIDLASVPGLDSATGLFGSVVDTGSAYGDQIIIIMVYVYDTIPPESVV